MAKVNGALLSLSATGKIAKTIVFSTWKGQGTARQYVKPSNPKTALQVAHRALFSACVSFWRTFLTNPAQQAGWNKEASTSGKPQSGFNSYQSAALAIVKTDPDGSMVTSAVDATGQVADISLLNLDDGAPGDEAGDFDIYVGSLPTNLVLDSSDTIISGTITTDGLTVGVNYIQVRKGGINRSGIFAVTIA